MKIDTLKMQHLLHNYHAELHCQYLSDIITGGKKYKAESDILLFDINNLVKNGIKEIDVVFNVTLYEYLVREFPGDFRKASLWLDYYQIDHYLEDLEKANPHSKRKRFLYNIGDIYAKDGAKAQQSGIIIKHKEKLDYMKWKSIKTHIKSTQKFFCRSSENGIILFVCMKSDGTSDYLNKFSQNADLIAAMVSRRNDKTTEIAPDFIPSEDVFSVTLPGKLLEEYINTSAKLIIFTENITAPYKEALIQVKNYDPFVRLMVAPPYDPKMLNDFLLQVKMVYNTDRWKK